MPRMLLTTLMPLMVLVMAIVLELTALATLWPGSLRDSVLYDFLWVHLVSSLLLAGAGWLLIPVQFRYPRTPLLLLWFNFAFFVPVLGMIGVCATVVLAGFRRPEKIAHPFAKLVLPEFVLSLREPDAKFSQGAIRSRLAHISIPTPQRLQSLLALQGIPARISSPLLRDMLDDASDDIRLVAYGLLDGREKEITARIHSELGNLKEAKSPDLKLIGNKQLAELYWELVYAGLAQGDLRIHALNQARGYADAALTLAPRDSGMLFLKGRILYELKSPAEAQRMLALAVASGLPEFRALPYLIEIAFDRGDYATVHSQLTSLSAFRVTPMMAKAANFWMRRTGETETSLSKAYAL
ncbi:tetratricopeptide repeat protein [Ferrigenium sp. UT5]|uniref:tetratricopeptide repeat protein n=1 Tax=Ferrigenium sp. UT5 TaxID=3242105 RepID=UPI00354E3E23